MAKTITPTITDADYRIAADNGRELLEKAFAAAVDLPLWAINRVVESWDLGDSCYSRDDYVGAWMAYGTGFLAILDNERFSLLKRDKDGKIV